MDTGFYSLEFHLSCTSSGTSFCGNWSIKLGQVHVLGQQNLDNASEKREAHSRKQEGIRSWKRVRKLRHESQFQGATTTAGTNLNMECSRPATILTETIT